MIRQWRLRAPIRVLQLPGRPTSHLWNERGTMRFLWNPIGPFGPWSLSPRHLFRVGLWAAICRLDRNERLHPNRALRPGVASRRGIRAHLTERREVVLRPIYLRVANAGGMLRMPAIRMRQQQAGWRRGTGERTQDQPEDRIPSVGDSFAPSLTVTFRWKPSRLRR